MAAKRAENDEMMGVVRGNDWDIGRSRASAVETGLAGPHSRGCARKRIGAIAGIFCLSKAVFEQ
jgi:hypothetical protein